MPPDTPILGGRVTPHPTDRMIAVHPSQFIRCTSPTVDCHDLILFFVLQDNVLKGVSTAWNLQIRSQQWPQLHHVCQVEPQNYLLRLHFAFNRADSGSFDALEAHYLIT